MMQPTKQINLHQRWNQFVQRAVPKILDVKLAKGTQLHASIVEVATVGWEHLPKSVLCVAMELVKLLILLISDSYPPPMRPVVPHA